jgi:hypothetical protein
LQKSTGGTWPAHPGEQPVGVVDLAYKGCARKRVGSWTEVAKPRYQWRPRRFALSASDRAERTGTRRWKVLRAWETAAWVCCHVERVLGSGRALRPKGRRVKPARQEASAITVCGSRTGRQRPTRVMPSLDRLKTGQPLRGEANTMDRSWCTRHPNPRHHPGPAMPSQAANRRQRRRCCP